MPKREPAAPSEFDATAYVRVVAPAMGLMLDEADIAAAATQLERAATFAAVLIEAAPDIGDEAPAPVFDPALTLKPNARP